MTFQISERFLKLNLKGFSKAYIEQIDHKLYQEMSFDDRLALLVDREEIEKQNRSMKLKLGNARFKNSATFDNLIVSQTRGLDKTTLQMLGTCEWVRKKKNIIVTAPSGCGKTFLATAISHNACLLGFTARYYRISHLFNELEIANDENRLRKSLIHLGKFNVMILDDFLLSSINEPQQKLLFELIDERNDNTSTIFTSQNPISLWHSLMPNPAIADAILDRVTHSAIKIELKGDSLRRKKATELDLGHAIQA